MINTYCYEKAFDDFRIQDLRYILLLDKLKISAHKALMKEDGFYSDFCKAYKVTDRK